MKDEILSFREMCDKLKINMIQRGMNFHIKPKLSVILMSVRPGAPYNDEIDVERNLLIYEGHDYPKSKSIPNPKKVDQPLETINKTLTQNGKFVKSIEEYKKGNSEPEKILVFEKLNQGLWSEKGLFELVDYEWRFQEGRKVIKFTLRPIEEEVKIQDNHEEHNRLIPTHVKVEVWKRDRGKCVLCGETKNLHYDHDLPFSKGGSSITEKNIRILCAKCNLQKGGRIE